MEQNFVRVGSSTEAIAPSVYSTLMRNVYVWMTLALTVTGLTAAFISQHPGWMQTIFETGLFWGLIVGEVILVIALSAALNKMSFTVASIMFVLYSIVNGATLSFIFLAYTTESIATTFFVTAGTFATMALIGTFVKKDFSGFGRILMMSLVGLIIATLVNVFWANSTLYWITTYAGVIVFVGLTAYDTQKIKVLMQENAHELSEDTMKLALMGSLTLYLDFINLFIYLLRIFGNRD